ncbi:helix-turn-helix domain-containing protein [Sphingomonas sp. OTU376]|uniref:helix-turn-helix domain-containing protein n=1 Tax=Sphingomonas sp. OTU376 TaxID=3043863 RepID=UPI00406C69D3
MIDDRRHTRIKSALALKGLTLSSIARDLGVAPGTVSIVSRGFRRSRRIETAIATALGCRPADLWPERYLTHRREEARK